MLKKGDRAHYLEVRDGDPIPKGWAGVRIGSEYCSQLLPTSQNVGRMSEEKDPGSLSLVTPVAGPDEISSVLDTVTTAVSQGWGEVVVNDWGVLDVVGNMEGIKATAGRLLMRFRRGPGVFDQWDDMGEEPDPSTRRYFAWGPLYDSPFLAFLKEKGVTRIELDPPRHWLELPDLDGFRFSLHRNTRLISVSAACPWLYDENKGAWDPIKGCERVCAAHNDIVMTSDMLKGPLFLRGRAVYERVEMDVDELELPENVDRFIYDRAV